MVFVFLLVTMVSLASLEQIFALYRPEVGVSSLSSSLVTKFPASKKLVS